MATFFSPEWVADVDAAVQASADVAAAAKGKKLVFEQAVTDHPDGPVAYHLIVDDGTVRAVMGAADAPTVSIQGPWETYIRINKGEISPPIALLSGKSRVTGERLLLIRQQALFSAIHQVTVAVPADY
jgi:putative sterol carrier protein